MANGDGRFADLSSYRRLVDAQRAANIDPLNTLLGSVLSGAQQGSTLVNLPEIIQQQNEARRNEALMGQLEAQLMQSRVNEALNPDLAVNRRIREQLATDAMRLGTGVGIATPGLEGDTIFQPGALTPEQQSLLNLRSVAAEQAGVPLVAPRAEAVAAPITPLLDVSGRPTGFTRDISAGIEETEALSRARGASTAETAALRNAAYLQGLAQRRDIAGEQIASRERIATTKAAKPLTESQKLSELSKAAKFGIDVDLFRDPTTGETDWAAVATARGRAEGEQVRATNVIRELRRGAASVRGERPTISQENFQLYGGRLEAAHKELEDITKKGFDPSSLGSEGLVGSFLPNVLKTSERQQFEQAQRNFINAVLRKESGAVISESEFENARAQYFPQPGDSAVVIQQKEETRKLVVDEFKRLGGRSTQSGVAPAIRITTQQDYDALPSGASYIDSQTSIESTKP